MSGGDSYYMSAPTLPPPPPKEDFVEVIDEIGGTRTFETTENGKKVRKTVRLPRPPEEEKRHQAFSRLMQDSLIEIERLNKLSPQSLPAYAPFVKTLNDVTNERFNDMQAFSKMPNFDDFVSRLKKMESDIINRQFDKASNQNYENMSRSGYVDSTAASENRALLAGEQARALEQSALKAEMTGRQMQEAELNNQQKAYALRDSERAARLKAAEAEYLMQKENRNTELQDKIRGLQIGQGLQSIENSMNLASNAPSMASGLYQFDNNLALSRYNADVNRQNMNFRNEMAAQQFNKENEGMGIGDIALAGAGILGGNILGGIGGSIGRGFGKKILSGFD